MFNSPVHEGQFKAAGQMGNKCERFWRDGKKTAAEMLSCMWPSFYSLEYLADHPMELSSVPKL
jgi:hypothetical protein